MAQKYNIKLLPNLPDFMLIFNVKEEDFERIESIGGEKVKEAKNRATFRIPTSAINEGEVWVGFNAPKGVYNHYIVANLDIRTWSSGMIFAEIKDNSNVE